MKKFLTKLFMVTVLLTMTTNVNAQKMTYPGVHLGLRVGPTFDSYGVGFLGGLAADFRLGRIPFYVETGAYFGAVAGGEEDHFKTDRQPCPMVPLLFSYHIYLNRNISIQPFTGATGSFNLREAEINSATYRIGVGFNFKRLYLNVGYDIELTMNHYPNFFFTTLGFNIAGRR